MNIRLRVLCDDILVSIITEFASSEWASVENTKIKVEK